MGSALLKQWSLDPAIDYLNHGSFGACPRAVLAEQATLRTELEAGPMRFFAGLLARQDRALEALAAYVGAAADDLVWVNNATTGVNAVLRSLRFERGDELLVTDHAYNACRNALDWVARERGATVVVASIPFPIASEGEAIDAIASAITDRTVLALIDHITSSTALVLPLPAILGALHARGVDVLVDGAHAPGMLELDLDALGAAYYTGNCHKWLCAPKGVGFLHVRSDRQELVAPTVISHGANSHDTERSRFQLLFDWIGTDDPSARLCVPAAIDAMAAMVPGGWAEIRERNNRLCLEGRSLLCEALDTEPTAPDSMTAAMATIALGRSSADERATVFDDPLTIELYEKHGIELRVFPFPWPRRMMRISAQLYNSIDQYQRLAEVLSAMRL